VGVPTFNRFHDEPDSPFYQAAGLSPEDTWDEVVKGMETALAELRERSEAGRFTITPSMISGWHELIFASTFPEDAGRFRWKKDGEWDHVSFGIRVGTARSETLRPMRGAHPNRIREVLQTGCDVFDRRVSELQASTVTLREVTHIAARLYAKVCSAHPFVDGNLRAAFVTLQAGLLNLDLPAVEFPGHEEHTKCLDAALRVDSRKTFDPLAELIERAIKAGV